nr:hypothetical protein [Tanacetum cinerariifolium]
MAGVYWYNWFYKSEPHVLLTRQRRTFDFHWVHWNYIETSFPTKDKEPWARFRNAYNQHVTYVFSIPQHMPELKLLMDYLSTIIVTV